MWPVISSCWRRLLNRPRPAAAAADPVESAAAADPVESAAATAAAADPTVAPAIPRYPPFLEGLPAAPVAQVVATQADLLERLRQTLGVPAEVYSQVVEPALAAYAAWVHLLPASEAHHHRGGGGLWRHGLEVALLATQAAQGRLFGYGEPPARRRELEPRWRVAALLAGLCHDLGKPATDLTVSTTAGFTWNPWLAPLADWLQTTATARYYLYWRGGRHGQHEVATLAVVPRVLPPAGLAWLAEPDPGIVQSLLEALAGRADRSNPLADLVSSADRHSVEQDLRTWRRLSGQSALGVPVEHYLLDAIRRQLRAGTWTVNVVGARVWVLADGAYLVWRAAARDIIDLLAQDRVAGIPRDPDTLADLLLERGLATPRELPQGRYRYWRIRPDLLAGTPGQKPVALYTLRLEPTLLFEGASPAPVAAQFLVAEEEDETAPAAAPAPAPAVAPAPAAPAPAAPPDRPAPAVASVPAAPAPAAMAVAPPGGGAAVDPASTTSAAAAPAAEPAPVGKPDPNTTAAVPSAAPTMAAARRPAPGPGPTRSGSTPAATAPPPRLIVDFLERLQPAWQAQRLPFTVARAADGWRLPWEDASNWYTRQTGVSRSALLADLRQPVDGDCLAAIDHQQRGHPAALVLPLTALGGPALLDKAAAE